MEFLKHMKVKDEWKHSNLAIFYVYVIQFTGEYLIEVEIEFNIIYIYIHIRYHINHDKYWGYHC
jgi:hypothetical protein